MRHVLISGGSRGIGASVVDVFAGNGWRVTYLYKHAPGFTSPSVTALQCDVSDPAVVRETLKDIGDVDVFVSNSGVSLTGLATDFDSSDYRLVMDTNFGGLFNIANVIIPGMVRRKSGVIIAVSSMWGQAGASCEALYSASKGAVDSYVKSLAKELGPSGIRVNAVSPGVIMTDMMKAYSQADRDELADETPLGRLGTPSDVAETIYFLTTEKASFITGQIIGINGGFVT